MSTVAFGALSTRREQSDSGKSTSEQPPGLSFYVDILAGLVPAEVLAINAIVVASVTAHGPPGQVTLAGTGTYRWMFWLLLVLAAILFVLGRRPAPALDPGPASGPAAEADGPAGAPAARQQNGNNQANWQNLEWQDLIRTLIAPAAYVCWTMVQPTGVWSAIVPGMSSGTRLLIPLVGAVALGAVTKALASHADKKPSPAQRRASTAQHPAPDPVPGPARPIVPAPEPPAPPAPTDDTDGADNTDDAAATDTTDAPAAPPVPSWVY